MQPTAMDAKSASSYQDDGSAREPPERFVAWASYPPVEKPPVEAKTPKADAVTAGVFEMPVFYMRFVFLWPEGQNALTRFMARFVFPVFNWQVIVGGLSFIAVGEYTSFVPPLTALGDVTASLVCLCKLMCLRRAGPQLLQLRRQLQYDFKPLEYMAEPEASSYNARCVSRCRSISRRFIWLYLPLCLSAGGLVVTNALTAPEERRLTVSMPRPLLASYFYWPLMAGAILGVITFLFYSVAYDSMFVSLCLHLSCKCAILKVLLRRAGHSTGQHLMHLQHLQQHGKVQRSGPAWSSGSQRKEYEFEYWNDNGTAFEASAPGGSREEIDDNIRTCVLYHHMVIRMRDETENIFAGVSLVQMAYVLLALCIPALRLLHEKTVSFTDVTFVILYFSWNFSQLLFYCWFADMLAESSQEVSVAAYAAMRPSVLGEDMQARNLQVQGGQLGAYARSVCNLSKAGGTTLQLITLRAQKPLHLTAGNFANLTLVLYLEIIRKSQSYFSYLIRLR